jgi:outer membrane protein OmpA-like peptidoglycan-associated protein
MKKYTGLFCAALLFLTGCGSKKSKRKAVNIDFFKDTKNSSARVKQSSKKTRQALQENLDAFVLAKDDLSSSTFALHNNDMNSFAFDKSAEKTTAQQDSAPLFQWDNIKAEESKKSFNTLYFDFNKQNIKSTETTKLNQDIELAKNVQASIENDNKKIIIEGHACHSAGSAAYNLALSEQRARNVAKEFMNQGVDKNNIKIAPRGQEMPVAYGNRAAQALNRRAEIFVIDSAASTTQA